MRLELASFNVRDIRFDGRTSYENGILVLDRAELLQSVARDTRIAGADLHIVRPAEKVRVVAIRDVVEPRVKASGPGCVFPGVLGPVATVGEGLTNRLSGMALVTSAYLASKSGHSGADLPTGSVLDMWGPGATTSIFSATQNLVLAITLRDDLSELDNLDAIQMAQLKLADLIARTTLGLAPTSSETFELFPVDPSLPKVAYILGCRTNPLDRYHPGISFYGLPLQYPLPTFMHPNEFFDGVVTRDVRRGQAAYPTAWEWQNHPAILGLYRAHGKTINFLGVVFQSQHHMFQHGKEVTAEIAAQLARLLGAEGAIISRTHVSGNRFIDTMFTVQACAKKGIKPVLITPEYGGRYGEDLPFLYTVPEADAIISTGSLDRLIEFPTPDRVIGPPGHDDVLLDLAPTPGKPAPPARQPVLIDGRTMVAGGIDWWGGTQQRCAGY